MKSVLLVSALWLVLSCLVALLAGKFVKKSRGKISSKIASLAYCRSGRLFKVILQIDKVTGQTNPIAPAFQEQTHNGPIYTPRTPRLPLSPPYVLYLQGTNEDTV